MTDFINFLSEQHISTWIYIALSVAVILFGIFAYWFVHTRIFKFRLRKIVKAKDKQQAKEALENFSMYYPPEKLVRYSKRMERYSRQWGPQVVRETGLADKWTQKLIHSSLPRAADLRRVLLYCPSSSTFKAFLAAEKHPRLRRIFTNWMKTEGEEKAIRILAESCRGEEFEPVLGKSFLDNHGSLIRELTGEAEWYARYFAYRILILDKETLTGRILDDGIMDPHPLIRKIITEIFYGDKDKIWNVLWDKLIHDPVYEVRETARKRISKEFMNVYSLKDKTLNVDETFRVLELLDPDSQEDRSYAMSILESDNRELSYPAVVFLEKCGVLASRLAMSTLDDPGYLENSVRLLQKALNVNVSSFLKDYPSGDGAPLLVVARLLAGEKTQETSKKPDANTKTAADFYLGITHENISYLEKKVFAFFNNKKIEPSTKEIYTKTLEAVASKGSIRSFELLAEELSRRENDPHFLELLLPRIPAKGESLLSPILFRFIKNPAFSARKELVQILASFSPDIVLPQVFRILNGPRTEYPHELRILAFKILIHLHMPFCLQRILESLPTLRPEETEDFARLIADYHPQETFEEKAKALLATPDARIRASLISILPATKNESFIKEIRSSLKDVDPDVRVAAIKALLGFGEIKLLNQETSMLHDPVERVRLATAEVIARHGNADAMEILKNTITDPNETDVVKTGVIMGLGQAVNAEGLSILISVLVSENEYCECAQKALAMRTSKRDIIKLVEVFKDAELSLREKLIPVFKHQGKAAEPMILEILKDEIASLKPHLVKILEETGYIDEVKRRLSHRNVEIRREAAYLLSLFDTLHAFRGLVLAAKDPDQEVRVCVVKALEKLKSPYSLDTLDKLKNDPDTRIRKYTHWALERLNSLAME